VGKYNVTVKLPLAGITLYEALNHRDSC